MHGGSSKIYMQWTSFPGFYGSCGRDTRMHGPRATTYTRLCCKISRESLPFPIPLLLYLWRAIKCGVPYNPPAGALTRHFMGRRQHAKWKPLPTNYRIEAHANGSNCYLPLFSSSTRQLVIELIFCSLCLEA